VSDSSENVAVRCRTEQTIYVPDKDYVWSEPSTPPSPACPAAQSLNEENSADTEDKADSTGMLNFTYPVSTRHGATRLISSELYLVTVYRKR